MFRVRLLAGLACLVHAVVAQGCEFGSPSPPCSSFVRAHGSVLVLALVLVIALAIPHAPVLVRVLVLVLDIVLSIALNMAACLFQLFCIDSH